MADEIGETFKLLRATLFANPTLQGGLGNTSDAFRFYAPDQVPSTPLYPYGLIEFVAGGDVKGVGGVRLMTTPLMLVRLVNKGPVDEHMMALTSATDAALSAVVATVSGGFVFSIERERPHRRFYQDAANTKFNEAGGYYRCHVRPQ